MPGPTGLNETRLNKTQAGTETTPGTAVAATRKVYAAMQFTPAVTANFPAQGTGIFDPNIGSPAVGRQTVPFTGTDGLTYEDLAWWAQRFVKGGVVGVTDAGTPPAYTFDFVPSAATDDLASTTWEWGDPGNPYQADQGFIDTWTIRIDPNNQNETMWMLEVGGMARTFVSHPFTASIPDRTREFINAAGTKVYIDPGGGTIGTTSVTGQIISANVSGNLNRHLKYFMEDQFSASAGRYGRGDRTLTATLQMEFFDDVEFANLRSTTPVERLVRFEQTGSQIHGSTATNKRARLDVAGYWTAISFGDRNGNKTATFTLTSSVDSTLGYSHHINVVNALATLP